MQIKIDLSEQDYELACKYPDALYGAYAIAIKNGTPLPKDTCEDAISRKAMLDYQQYLHGKMSNEENHKLWEFIKDLPPAAHKKEKWIEDGYHNLPCVCSYCGHEGKRDIKICPNCKKEMEVEEE